MAIGDSVDELRNDTHLGPGYGLVVLIDQKAPED
jgi:hypothetical protein